MWLFIHDMLVFNVMFSNFCALIVITLIPHSLFSIADATHENVNILIDKIEIPYNTVLGQCWQKKYTYFSGIRWFQIIDEYWVTLFKIVTEIMWK